MVTGTVTLDPPSTIVGKTVLVKGNGFTANSKVTVKYDAELVLLLPPTGAIIPGSLSEIKTGADGTFAVKFVIPEKPFDGSHAVQVIIGDDDPVVTSIMVDNPMRMPIRILLVAYYFSILVVSGYLLVCHSQITTIQNFMEAHPETRFILLAGLFGLMGSSVHGISSLTVWAGNQKLAKSWGMVVFNTSSNWSYLGNNDLFCSSCWTDIWKCKL